MILFILLWTKFEAQLIYNIDSVSLIFNKRGTSQLAPGYSLSLKKTPTVNKKNSDPP